VNLRRSPRFSFLLVILVVLVGVKIYRIWEDGLPELPSPVKEKSTVNTPKERRGSLRSLRRSTANIIKKNLFDPKRGAGGEKVVEPTLQSKQSEEEFVLLGTMITSGGRKAIIRVSPTAGGGVVRGRRPRVGLRCCPGGMDRHFEPHFYRLLWPPSRWRHKRILVTL